MPVSLYYIARRTSTTSYIDFAFRYHAFERLFPFLNHALDLCLPFWPLSQLNTHQQEPVFISETFSLSTSLSRADGPKFVGSIHLTQSLK